MEKKKLPIFKLVIDPTDDTGVSFVALVDEPAIERAWMAFSKQESTKIEFKASQTEEMVLEGPLMVADLLIPRYDPKMGKYLVMFEAPTIKQIVRKFMRNGFQKNVNLQHEKKVDGVYLYELWLIDNERGKGVPKGHDPLPTGSAFGSFKVDNKQVWDDVKNGIFTGFSIEGMFDYERMPDMGENEIQKSINEIQKMFSQLCDLASDNSKKSIK